MITVKQATIASMENQHLYYALLVITVQWVLKNLKIVQLHAKIQMRAEKTTQLVNLAEVGSIAMMKVYPTYSYMVMTISVH